MIITITQYHFPKIRAMVDSMIMVMKLIIILMTLVKLKVLILTVIMSHKGMIMKNMFQIKIEIKVKLLHSKLTMT